MLRFSPLREGDAATTRGLQLIDGLIPGFSPLREGDAATTRVAAPSSRISLCFSPLREGDAATTWESQTGPCKFFAFQSPSRRGRRYNPSAVNRGMQGILFQSPSRRGRRYNWDQDYNAAVNILVSVPFAKGTPLQLDWRDSEFEDLSRFSPLREGDAATTWSLAVDRVRIFMFQSPSRRGRRYNQLDAVTVRVVVTRFSPLREGDAATTRM